MKSKIISGILALLVSIGLWLYVVTVVNPEWEETYYNIPVVLENEEVLHNNGLMLMMDDEPKVTLRLSGNRTDMIKLNSSNITIRVDVGKLGAGEQSVKYDISYPGAANAYTLISQSPQQITLNVVERKSKPVDVVAIVGDTDPGYIALMDEATMDYEKITISGPANVVDRIVAAEITVDLTGQKETISQQYDYILRDAEGNAVESQWLKVTPEKINYTLKIQKLQEVNIAVDVLEGSGLTADDCQIFCYNQENGELITEPIAISGSETQLAVLRSVGLLRENMLYLDKKVVLSQMVGTDTDEGLEIVLENLDLNAMLAPYEITNQSLVNTIKVVVKIPNLDLKEVQIDEFVKVGLPEGTDATFVTPYIKVVLRGPRAVLEQITEKNLVAEVNFAGAIPDGNNKDYPVTVMVYAEGVYVIRTYKVNATVVAVAG